MSPLDVADTAADTRTASTALRAAAAAHQGPAAADRRQRRPQLHVVRPGRRRRHRRSDEGRARPDRLGRRPAHRRVHPERAARPDRDPVGSRLPQLRRVPGLHPGQGHRRARRRRGAAAALHDRRAVHLRDRPLQRGLARPDAGRHRRAAAPEREGQPPPRPLLPAGAARRAPHRRILPRPLARDPRVHGQARRLAGPPRIEVRQLLRLRPKWSGCSTPRSSSCCWTSSPAPPTPWSTTTTSSTRTTRATRAKTRTPRTPASTRATPTSSTTT